MEMSNCDLGSPCEGSFGAHPPLFFVSFTNDFLIFIDKKNNLQIFDRKLSSDTNFSGSEIKNENKLLDFAVLLQFRSRALLLRGSKNDNTSIVKGIANLEHLKKSFHAILR